MKLSTVLQPPNSLFGYFTNDTSSVTNRTSNRLQDSVKDSLHNSSTLDNIMALALDTQS